MGGNMENNSIIYIVSDSLGETARSIAKACIYQFPNHENWDIKRFSYINNKDLLNEVFEEAKGKRVLVMYSLVNPELAEYAKEYCERENIEYLEPHHFAYDIIIGFRQLAEPAGFEVETVPVDTDFQKNTTYDIFMLEHDYAGSFVLGFSLHDPWINDFKDSHTPAVLFDNYVTGNPSTAYVGIDNSEGMELILDHLTNLGHKKIAYLSGSLGSYVLQMRHAAFLHSMHSHGHKTTPENTGCSYYLSECIEKHLPRFLEAGMTAIICSHDSIAAASITQCHQLGYKVPEDVSIIGFDDLPIAAYTSPPLTTIKQDRIELGKSGFFALSSLLSNIPISTFLLHAKLIERKTTSKVCTGKKSDNL